MTEVDSWLQELLRLQGEEEKITDKQAKILQAAVEIFSEKGYSAASTSEIAQKAGVAEGTIFRHYKTKKELLLSIVSPVMSNLIAPFVMREFSKVLDVEYARFEDFLRAVINNRMEFVSKHTPVLKIMLQEIPFQPELREQFTKKVTSQIFERFGRIIQTFQSKGQIVALPSFQAIRLASSTVIGFLILRYFMLPERDWNDEEEIQATIDFILYGLAPRS